jgi:lipopolysaccharide/colanic/teichoic acid biosynthesis glycosyltransferase
MSSKECPIVAKVLFSDGNTVFFKGDRYVKDGDCNLMVYKLRTMLIKLYPKTKSIQMFDNRIMTGDRIIFEYQNGIMLKNDLKSYLGENYNPPL